jgi:mono/diheme cytochrome c family protein
MSMPGSASKVCLAGLALCSIAAIAGPAAPVFSKDVAPILFKHCVECHRAGEVAPMPLTSYKEVRPWAKAIRDRVVARTMPVWLADPRYGSFRNDPRLSQIEIDTIASWVASGAPEGDAKDTPALPKFEEGWRLGKPDLIIDMGTDFEVPAEGVLPVQSFRVPSGFKEDRWVSAAEVHPGNRAIVHHMMVFLEEPGEPSGIEGRDAPLAGYAPGSSPRNVEPGMAALVKAGSTFRFQVHYTPNGTASKDRSYLGLYFAKGPVRYRALSQTTINAFFRIPPGDPNHEVKSSWTVEEDVQLTGLIPHMHFRGKDFKYTLTYPDGRQQVLLYVPRYDFNWQLEYDFKDYVNVPKDARIDCVAHFDNSVNNPFNPDPAEEVRWGDQTWEEMMATWIAYVVPAKVEAPNPVE